jgi:hypothetical protein
MIAINQVEIAAECWAASKGGIELYRLPADPVTGWVSHFHDEAHHFSESFVRVLNENGYEINKRKETNPSDVAKDRTYDAGNRDLLLHEVEAEARRFPTDYTNKTILALCRHIRELRATNDDLIELETKLRSALQVAVDRMEVAAFDYISSANLNSKLTHAYQMDNWAKEARRTLNLIPQNKLYKP